MNFKSFRNKLILIGIGMSVITSVHAGKYDKYVKLKIMADAQSYAVNNNPLYEEATGMSGEMPLFESAGSFYQKEEIKEERPSRPKRATRAGMAYLKAKMKADEVAFVAHFNPLYKEATQMQGENPFFESDYQVSSSIGLQENTPKESRLNRIKSKFKNIRGRLSAKVKSLDKAKMSKIWKGFTGNIKNFGKAIKLRGQAFVHRIQAYKAQRSATKYKNLGEQSDSTEFVSEQSLTGEVES